jgi:hypothetical protein
MEGIGKAPGMEKNRTLSRAVGASLLRLKNTGLKSIYF